MRPLRLTLTLLVVLAIFVVVGVLAWHHKDDLLPFTEGCRADVGGHRVDLDLEQAQNAALISAVSVQRGLPPRAATIALATAFQESKLRNLEHGDRDSIGLFQQRPSQGWGTRDQILDPYYSINRFYDALVKVDGYTEMEITDAAQEVQRSAFPGAYADHEEDARALASALTGETTGGAFTCEIRDDAEPASTRLNSRGLTRRADTVRKELLGVFGDVSLGGFEPGGARSGHMAGSAHYDGRAIDVFVRPVSPANKQRGWAIAAYLVAQAGRLDIQHVIFDGKIWTAGRASSDGWRDYHVPSGSNGSRVILEHRDHIHVDVAP